MNEAVFTIAKGVAIPARTLPSAGPRESKYPVDQLQEGDAFAVSCRDEKEARQKQSQFSALARTRKIALVTRIITKAEDNPGFEGVEVPFIAVWHDGARKVRKSKKATAGDALQGALSDEAEASAGGDEATEAAAVPAPPAPAAVLEL